jgi:fatty-acyl-CoA synthase
MRSTMQEWPLSLATLVRYGTTIHGGSQVTTWAAEGARTTSYSDLGRQAARLAHALRGLGVTSDLRVATFMWNNTEHMAAYLAVPAMGSVLHTLNVRLFPEQLVYVANHAEDYVVLVDGTLLPLFAKLLPELKTVRHVVVTAPGDASALSAPGVAVHSWDSLVAAQPDEFEWGSVDERDAAAICYTSGTTAQPRGVAYSHRSMWLHSMQICMGDGFGLTQADKVLAIVPMFHATSWGLPYAALMVGASLVMPDRFLQAEPLAAMIASERPTFAGAVPTIWNDLLRYGETHKLDLSSLREVVVGGSAVPPALMKAYEERYALRIIHAWGMTEMSPLGSVARPPRGLDTETEWGYRVSQGRLPAAVEGRLIGPSGDVVPPDGKSVGELEVRGPWVTASYLGAEDPDRFVDGWLRTGDVGTLSADGFLTLTDRAKDVIKSGGEWISSVELENHLMAHPEVAEATVVGVPDDRWVERPLAAVVRTQGSALTAAELRDFLTGRIAAWQLPERWTFIDEVPKTSVGKFDKKSMRQAYADGKLDVQTVLP